MKRLNLTPRRKQCAQGCGVWVNLRQRTKASRRLGPLQVKGRSEYRYSHGQKPINLCHVIILETIVEPGISTMVKYSVPWPLPGTARSKQGAVTGKDISGSDYYKSSYDPVCDIALVDRLPTRLLAKFEDADAAQGKNLRGKRPLDFMHGQISRLGLLRHITSCYLPKVPTRTIQIPGYWNFGFALTFTSIHASPPTSKPTWRKRV